MKALLSKSVGGPDTLVLEDMPSPSPGPASRWSRSRPAGSTIPTC